MTDIIITTTLSRVPVNSLAVLPNITIWETDGTVAQASTAMTDSGVGGKHIYTFSGAVGVDYMFEVDADPSVTGQVDDRYFGGSFNRELNDVYTRLGLNLADPITDTTAGIDSASGDIDITRTGDGETTSTLTRQP